MFHEKGRGDEFCDIFLNERKKYSLESHENSHETAMRKKEYHESLTRPSPKYFFSRDLGNTCLYDPVLSHEAFGLF